MTLKSPGHLVPSSMVCNICKLVTTGLRLMRCCFQPCGQAFQKVNAMLHRVVTFFFCMSPTSAMSATTHRITLAPLQQLTEASGHLSISVKSLRPLRIEINPLFVFFGALYLSCTGHWCCPLVNPVSGTSSFRPYSITTSRLLHSPVVLM